MVTRMMMNSRYCLNSKISVFLIPVLLLFTACTAIGPPTVARDRFDYVNAMSESWKRQMLLNLAKIRYLDAPVFLDVASIINQYSVEGEVALGASWSGAITGNSQTVGGIGRYADRPTITYAPLSGARFTQQLMTPIPVVAILSLLQSGYPADNPDQTGFAYLRIGYMASDRTVSASDRKKAGGLFQSVRDAAKQVEETRLMAERGTYLATQIPILAGGLGDYWMSDLVKNQDIKTLLEDVHRLSVTVDQLPEVIAQERSAAINQSMQKINVWSRAAIDQTMRGISAEREQALGQLFSEFNKERQNTLADMLTQEKTYSRLMIE